MLQTGDAAINGSVGGMVARNLRRLATLIDRSLVEARIDSGTSHRQRVAVLRPGRRRDAVGSSLEAVARHLALRASTRVDREDATWRSILAYLGAVSNLLDNAFKFTHEGGHVSLRTSATATRVLIEIQGRKCSGLPPGKADELFESLRAARRRPHRTGSRSLHQPQGRRGERRRAARARRARRRVRLQHRPAAPLRLLSSRPGSRGGERPFVPGASERTSPERGHRGRLDSPVEHPQTDRLGDVRRLDRSRALEVRDRSRHAQHLSVGPGPESARRSTAADSIRPLAWQRPATCSRSRGERAAFVVATTSRRFERSRCTARACSTRERTPALLSPSVGP